MAEPEIIAAVDAGTFRIRCLIGSVDDNSELSVIGAGSSLPAGIENGVVSDIDVLSASVEKAVNEACSMAGVEVESVFIQIAQTNFVSERSRGVHSPSRPNRPLTRLDVNRAIEVARLLSKKSNREIVQETIQDFIVDGQGSISNPVGMHANKLEADVYFVTGSVSNFTMTIKEAVRKTGLEVEGAVMKPIAAAEASVSNLEKKLGVLLVDLGHTSTSIAAFSDGKIIGAKILSTGAGKITNEIAARFHLPAHLAEKVKREKARALAENARENRNVHVQPDAEAEKISIPEKKLSEIAEKNLKDIFDLVRQESEKFKFQQGRGESIVLTGGGALLKDIDKYVSGRFNLPVRIGRPEGRVEGWGKLLNNPSYSTAKGLLLRGLYDRQLSFIKEIGWQNPLLKIQTWIKDFF